MDTFKFTKEYCKGLVLWVKEMTSKFDLWKSKCDFIKLIDFQTENIKRNWRKTTLCPVLRTTLFLKRNHNFLSQGQKLDLKSVDPPQTVSSLCIRMQVLNKKIKRLFSKTFYFVSTAEFESNKVKLQKKRLPHHKTSYIKISILLEILKNQEFSKGQLI